MMAEYLHTPIQADRQNETSLLHIHSLTHSFIHFITVRRSYTSAVLGVVILSIRLSVTRVLCDKTKQCTADILTPHERAIILHSDTNSGWSMTPLPSEICAQSDPPPSKNAHFNTFRLITSQP